MTTTARIAYSLLCILGVFLGTSAYIVYKNAVTGFPVGASFFWFVLFGFLTALLLPQDLRKRPVYSEFPGKSAIRSVRLYRPWVLILNPALYVLYFFCVLTILQNQQPGVVITLFILSQLQPVIGSLIGTQYLGDSVKNWRWYCLGATITIFGVVLYRYETMRIQGVNLFDSVIALCLIMLASANARNFIDAKTRRTGKIPQTDAVLILMAGSSILGFVWMLIESAPQLPPLPNTEQTAALIYLGVVPTSIALVFTNTARDKLGMPTTDAIANSRPLFGLLIGMIPLSWFALDHKTLVFAHYLGLLLTIVGVIIVITLAKGEAKKG